MSDTERSTGLWSVHPYEAEASIVENLIISAREPKSRTEEQRLERRLPTSPLPSRLNEGIGTRRIASLNGRNIKIIDRDGELPVSVRERILSLNGTIKIPRFLRKARPLP